MFRVITVAAVSAAVTVAAPALAAQHNRVASASYTGGSSQAGAIVMGADVAGHSVGSAVISTRRTERTIRVAATDSSGQRVGGEVTQRDASGGVRRLASFCGSMTKPARLFRPGTEVTVTMFAGTCTGLVTTPTTGTITATFAP